MSSAISTPSRFPATPPSKGGAGTFLAESITWAKWSAVLFP